MIKILLLLAPRSFSQDGPKDNLIFEETPFSFSIRAIISLSSYLQEFDDKHLLHLSALSLSSFLSPSLRGGWVVVPFMRSSIMICSMSSQCAFPSPKDNTANRSFDLWNLILWNSKSSSLCVILQQAKVKTITLFARLFPFFSVSCLSHLCASEVRVSIKGVPIIVSTAIFKQVKALHCLSFCT